MPQANATYADDMLCSMHWAIWIYNVFIRAKRIKITTACGLKSRFKNIYEKLRCIEMTKSSALSLQRDLYQSTPGTSRADGKILTQTMGQQVVSRRFNSLANFNFHSASLIKIFPVPFHQNRNFSQLKRRHRSLLTNSINWENFLEHSLQQTVNKNREKRDLMAFN